MSDSLLVLGTADWNQPIGTNQHYIVRELARERAAIYVESMGLRTPGLNRRDIERIGRRLGLLPPTRGAVSRRDLPPGVQVRAPRMLPRHTGLARRLNQPRIDELVADWAAQSTRLLWTYTPVTYGLESRADTVVYHCVDLYGEVDGISATLIHEAERNLAKYASIAIGTSPAVVGHLRAQGFARVEHWPNVADTEIIAAAQPPRVTRIPSRAVFAGALSSAKIDFEVLRSMIEAGFDLHLAGPVAEGDRPAARHLKLLTSLGATFHGLLEPTDLARLYWTCDLGLIPYVITPLTQGVDPLKTYEYLAAGLGVVSTPVPAVLCRPGHVEVQPSGRAFVGAAKGLAGAAPETRRARIAMSDTNSWTGRGAKVRALVHELETTIHTGTVTP